MKSIVARSRRIRDGRADPDRRVAEPIVVERVYELIASVRNLADGGSEYTLRVVLERRGVRERGAASVPCDGLAQSRVGDAVGGNLRREIAFALVRSSDIRQQQREHVFDDPAATRQPDRRQDQSFLIQLARHGHRARAHATHVGMVRAIRHEEGRLPFAPEKHGRDERDVRQMRSAPERIVQHHDIARLHDEGVDGRPNRQRHGAEVNGHVIALGDRLAPCVIHRARIIEPLLDVRREARPAQRHAHLLGDREIEVLEDFEVDGMDFHGLRPAALTITLPKPSTSNRTPAALRPWPPRR